MRQVTIYRYRLPINNWLNNLDIQQEKVGYIIKFSEFNNSPNRQTKSGIGEVAPLAGFSLESLDLALLELIEIAKNCLTPININSDNFDDINFNKYSPSVAFGVSCALAEFFDKNYFSQKIFMQNKYNAVKLLPINLAHEYLINNPQTKIIKIKIGNKDIKNNAEELIKIINNNCNLIIRIDANRAWGLDDALLFTQIVNNNLHIKNQISFFEEPCISIKDSLLFAKNSGNKIAIDETLPELINSTKNIDEKKIFTNDVLSKISQLIDKDEIAAVVIKPTLIGELRLIKKIIKLSLDLQKKVIISSALESSFSLNRLLSIAYQNIPQLSDSENFHHYAPGLDTMQFYQNFLIEDFDKNNYQLPTINLDDLEIIWQS